MSVNIYKSDGTLEKIAGQTNFLMSYMPDVIPASATSMTWAKTSDMGVWLQSLPDGANLDFQFEDTVSSASSENGVIVTISKKIIGTGTDKGYLYLKFAETRDVPVNMRVVATVYKQEV